MSYRPLPDYPRRAHLDFYRRHPSPFYATTFELDAARLRARLTAAGHSSYAGFCWAFHRALLQVPAFRVRLVDGEPVLFDGLRIGMTVPAPGRTFSFATLDWEEDAENFLPRAADWTEFRQRMAFNLGLRQDRPRLSDMSYIEKVEYWAVLWGTAIMAFTGLFLWSNDFTLRHLTTWFLDVARVIHYYEAILATLAIVVWHFYSVIFDPDHYPMQWTWITGNTDAEHWAEVRHPPAAQRLQQHVAGDPQQPCHRRLRSRPEPPRRGQRLHEGLRGQVQRELGRVDPPPEVREHERLVAHVELVEGGRPARRLRQQLLIGQDPHTPILPAAAKV